jgi:hypothetical protein
MPRGRPSCSDADIRRALHRKKLDRIKAAGDILVVDELGLAHARSRIDVAVINGCIHGYEIKSGQDTLERLPSQLEIYQDTLQRLTVVCASRHVDGVMRLTPKWCGITEVVEGSRGGVHFRTLRREGRNPHVRASMLAHLLWHSEAVTLLSRYEIPARELRRPRKQLYERIAELMTPREITGAIKEFMARRSAWRVPRAAVPYGD